jgi:hypothetical protein
MALSLKETRAISGLADVLYEFLPGSGHAAWKGHVNFRTVAAKVGVGDLWPGGSKKPAIVFLLTHTFERERSSFQSLILEIVRSGIIYRQKQGNPITAGEIDQVNGHILELGFKFPELWDKDFRNSLHQTIAERAQAHVAQADSRHKEESAQRRHSQELAVLKEDFLRLANEPDRSKAGLALEKLLNRLFELFGRLCRK